MRKIEVNGVKTGLVIFSFCLLVTLAFSGMIIWFQYSQNKEVTFEDNATYYPLDGTIINQIISAEEPVQLLLNKIVTANSLQKELFSQYVNQLLPFAVVFYLFLIFSSVLLWRILRRLQLKQDVRVANSLVSLNETEKLYDNPVLSFAYDTLKRRFADNLEDYKRLHSFLSHEQKNAITLLRANLELLEEEVPLQNLDYIADSIDDVLTLSETQETSVKGKVDPVLLCAEVCDSYLKTYPGIHFVDETQEDTMVLAKDRWIYRAVNNLVDNAVKYGEGKPITVTVRCQNDCVIICVKDKGNGIPLSQQNKIFSHRYRMNELNKDGYGIGLSLVSHVCDLCGGFAALDSEAGRGSAFYLSFPLSKD